jgi:hypothetical protein
MPAPSDPAAREAGPGQGPLHGAHYSYGARSFRPRLGPSGVTRVARLLIERSLAFRGIFETQALVAESRLAVLRADRQAGFGSLQTAAGWAPSDRTLQPSRYHQPETGHHAP